MFAAVSIAEKLSEALGPQNVFLDRLRLQPGTRFGPEMDSRLRASTTLVAVIGPRWHGPVEDTDGSPVSRLDDPDDWVRHEIATALALDIRIIPVIVRGAIWPPGY